MGSNNFINEEIYMYYLVKMDHNGMAAHLNKSAVHPMQWRGHMLWNESEEDRNGRCVRKIKALTVKVETVTMIGKGRHNQIYCVH